MENLTIGSGVESIDSYVFYNCKALIELTIPENVKTIGSRAFAHCIQMENLTIGSGVESIDSYVFYNCAALTELTIPESVKTIGTSSFANCSGLTEINFNANIESVLTENSNIFSCSGQSGEGITLTFGDNVSKVPDYLFYSGSTDAAPKITSIIIGNNVESIDSYAFVNCIQMENLTIGSGVESIDSYVFYNCTALTELTIPESVKTIGTSPFANCSGLTEINFNANIESVLTASSYIFSYSGQSGEGITLTFGDNVSKVPDYLFYSGSTDAAPKIKSIIIGDNVESIGNYAFRYCAALAELVISNNVKTIGIYAFANCSGLTEINFNANIESALTASSNIFYYSGQSGEGITLTFGDNVSKVPDYLFHSGSSNVAPKIKSIIIGNNVESIGNYAFRYCAALAGLVIPDNVKTIGTSSFAYCIQMENLTIGSGVESIEDTAFAYCESILNVFIPNSILSIGKSVFAHCSSLNMVRFEEGSQVVLKQNVFGFCSSLEYVYIASTMSELYDTSFTDSTNLKQVVWTNKAIITDFPADFSDLKCKVFLMEGYDKSLLKNLYLNIDGVGRWSIHTLTTMANILELIGREDMEIDVKIYLYNSSGKEEELVSGTWTYNSEGEIVYV